MSREEFFFERERAVRIDLGSLGSLRSWVCAVDCRFERWSLRSVSVNFEAAFFRVKWSMILP